MTPLPDFEIDGRNHPILVVWIIPWLNSRGIPVYVDCNSTVLEMIW